MRPIEGCRGHVVVAGMARSYSHVGGRHAPDNDIMQKRAMRPTLKISACVAR